VVSFILLLLLSLDDDGGGDGIEVVLVSRRVDVAILRMVGHFIVAVLDGLDRICLPISLLVYMSADDDDDNDDAAENDAAILLLLLIKVVVAVVASTGE